MLMHLGYTGNEGFCMKYTGNTENKSFFLDLMLVVCTWPRDFVLMKFTSF